MASAIAEQADALVNEALNVCYYRLDQLKSGITEAQHQVEDARQYVKQVVENTRKMADEATTTVAKSARMAAVTLILGAIGGIVGGNSACATAAVTKPCKRRSTPMSEQRVRHVRARCP